MTVNMNHIVIAFSAKMRFFHGADDETPAPVSALGDFLRGKAKALNK